MALTFATLSTHAQSSVRRVINAVVGTSAAQTTTQQGRDVEITGAGVEVMADRMNSISITGADSHVTYRSSGNKNGRATVNIVGAGSGVRKR